MRFGYLKVLLRHSHLSTHGDWLASILAVRVETVRLEEHLEIKKMKKMRMKKKKNMRMKNKMTMRKKGMKVIVDLVLLTLPVQSDLTLRPSHTESLAPVRDSCRKNRLLRKCNLDGAALSALF